MGHLVITRRSEMLQFGTLNGDFLSGKSFVFTYFFRVNAFMKIGKVIFDGTVGSFCTVAVDFSGRSL